VWNTRPSSPTIQPCRASAKQVPKRFWRISRAATGVGSPAAAGPATASPSAQAKVAMAREVWFLGVR